MEEIRKNSDWMSPESLRNKILYTTDRMQRSPWEDELTDFTQKDANPEAIKRVKQLVETYGVDVALVKDDAEYYSEVTLDKAISQKIYFVSNENWEKTADITEGIIRYEQRRGQLQAKIMYTRSIEKADQFSSRVGVKIEEIRKEYSANNGGKEPTLSKIADILTEQKIESPNGSTKWFAQSVKRVIERSKIER